MLHSRLRVTLTMAAMLAAVLLAACGGSGESALEGRDSERGGSEDTAGGEAEEVTVDCPGPQRNDFADGIAETYEVSYEQVIEWFCGGSPFDDILLALQTSEISGVAVDDILDMRATGMKWNDIWAGMGIPPIEGFEE